MKSPRPTSLFLPGPAAGTPCRRPAAGLREL